MLFGLLRFQLLNREHFDLTSQRFGHNKTETLQYNRLSDLRNMLQFIANQAAYAFKPII